ncbi:MAG: catechol 2,3-dioxygenase-like lactoylglutathione lyase family enzyme [Glaciecola sp.]|jgi:catechol 2,3-dioxygenase-like lactoylglutathione lyase family enzyme|uniref:VOC family protein n=1 Tax=Congregibacter sp. TaxID=2744308 RepID=UPI0039E2D192
MIGYVVLGTNDLAKSSAFYDALLGSIGVARMVDFGDRGYAWGANMESLMLCIMTPHNGESVTVGNGTMAASSVDSRENVDRTHAKAMELSGCDEGAPGLRAEGGEGFYAAYFRDLEGHKLDVFGYG